MRRIPVTARPFPQEVIVILGDEIENLFDVTSEDFPPGLPRTWNDPDEGGQSKPVTWVSNFRLVKRGEGSGQTVRYTIELDQRPGKLVAFDGERVYALRTRVTNSRVQGELAVEDPPIGWG